MLQHVYDSEKAVNNRGTAIKVGKAVAKGGAARLRCSQSAGRDRIEQLIHGDRHEIGR